MKSIETRLEILEKRQAQRPDPVTEELRVYLRKFMVIPGAAEIARECTDLHLKGVSPGAPEFLDLQRRHDALWEQHYGTEEGIGESINSWRAFPHTHALIVSSGWRPR